MKSLNKLFFLLILLLITQTSKAQNISFTISNYIEFGSTNDIGISANYQFNRSSIKPSIGLSFRSVNWGNQIELSGLISKSIYQTKTIDIGIGIGIFPGIALFQKNSLFSIGGSALSNLLWNYNPKFSLGIQIAVRYNNCPSYADYGIHSNWEIPIGILWGWKLGQKD